MPTRVMSALRRVLEKRSPALPAYLSDDIRRDIGLPERVAAPAPWRLPGQELVALWTRGSQEIER